MNLDDSTIINPPQECVGEAKSDMTEEPVMPSIVSFDLGRDVPEYSRTIVMKNEYPMEDIKYPPLDIETQDIKYPMIDIESRDIKYPK
eukprot:7377450-Ditylum_brightwellii.AAC.1